MREWVSENSDIPDIYNKIYHNVVDKLKDDQSKGDLAILISKSIYESNFAIDKEIHITALLCEIMFGLVIN